MFPYPKPVSTADENVAPGRSQPMNMVEVGSEHVDQLPKSPSGEQLSVSEKILIESSSERDRISEVKVGQMALCVLQLERSI